MLDPDEKQFKVVRDSPYEIVAYACHLVIGQAAYETARRLYPNERIDLRNGARVIARSDEGPAD